MTDTTTKANSVYDPTRPLAAQLSEAARTEYDELVKYNLNHAREQLVDALRKFEMDPNGTNLIAVNGFWAHGVRILDYAGKRQPPGGSGLRDGAKLTEAA